ncbi:hypothetical protein HWV07_03795 [Natronomonas salina]|uniref:hypothetical protein n=1 Tax=Natronomonas salina TaxID=1710540 RepID=UPI0015B61B5C|nr:hypothetical protein [Natronomonas salina]QLD88202.1 hypothetical protein HWV07_03795 [Natronomonas salina]
MAPDDSTDLFPFEGESKGVWWGGIVVASTITFICIGGLLVLLTYLVNHLSGMVIPYWPSIVVAAVATILLVRAAVSRGDIKYQPSE